MVTLVLSTMMPIHLAVDTTKLPLSTLHLNAAPVEVEPITLQEDNLSGEVCLRLPSLN
jgi:hypothetical protein